MHGVDANNNNHIINNNVSWQSRWGRCWGRRGGALQSMPNLCVQRASVPGTICAKHRLDL